MLCGDLNGKRIWRRIDTCICITKSLCCTPETNTTLLINYTPNKINKILKNKNKINKGLIRVNWAEASVPPLRGQPLLSSCCNVDSSRPKLNIYFFKRKAANINFYVKYLIFKTTVSSVLSLKYHTDQTKYIYKPIVANGSPTGKLYPGPNSSF